MDFRARRRRNDNLSLLNLRSGMGNLIQRSLRFRNRSLDGQRQSREQLFSEPDDCGIRPVTCPANSGITVRFRRAGHVSSCPSLDELCQFASVLTQLSIALGQYPRVTPTALEV